MCWLCYFWDFVVLRLLTVSATEKGLYTRGAFGIHKTGDATSDRDYHSSCWFGPLRVFGLPFGHPPCFPIRLLHFLLVVLKPQFDAAIVLTAMINIKDLECR
jgi:hypothetical protein